MRPWSGILVFVEELLVVEERKRVAVTRRRDDLDRNDLQTGSLLVVIIE